jgi:hypothetical protein
MYGGSYGGGMSAQRARPWSPNWNMNQGLSPSDATAVAFGGASSPFANQSPRRRSLLGYGY